MSNITTNGINTNYPIPGVNNSTQGFRDNFSIIKNALDTAGNEVTDLQNKAVLKSGLAGVAINNDMGNTIISNAVTRSFRASTYDLGSNLSGNVSIDVSRGDVQYGVLQGNVTIKFTNWMPDGTRGGIQLKLMVDTANFNYRTDSITLPVSTVDHSGNIIAGMNQSTLRLENYSSNGYPHVTGSMFEFTNKLAIPSNVTELNYNIYSDDCGTTIGVTPLDRGYKASQIEVRTPTQTGLPGDRHGQICTNGANLYVCIGDYDSTSIIWGKVTLTAV